jgi:hypothetical protein
MGSRKASSWSGRFTDPWHAWCRPMNVPRFRQLIRAVLLSAGPVGAAACTEDPTPMPERAPCVLEPTARYSALTLAPNIDGIAFATRLDAGAGDGSTTTERLPTLGLPCASATDAAACARRITELLEDPRTTGWTAQPPRGCFVCTSATDVGVIVARDEIRVASFADILAAVAPIDGRDEAAAVLLLGQGNLDCDGTNNARPEADGWVFRKTDRSCDGEVTERFWHVARDGTVTQRPSKTLEEGDDSCIEGRRPPMLAATGVPWLGSVASCFAEIAHMEAAAVLAFDELDRQLRALDAPWELRMRAARARADEVEHAAITLALARRFGERPPAPSVEGTRDPHAADALFRLALENAVEGCVREAYGALVAAHQAAHASDAGVRNAFERIAEDEAKHAELSFALDAWLSPRLGSKERAAVEDAKTRAWQDLVAGCTEPAPEVVRVAGMPTAARARALLRHLHSCTALAA